MFMRNPQSLLIVVFFLSCTADHANDNAIRTEVANTMERYMIASRAANANAISSFYTDDAVLFEPGIKPIQTRDSIRAFLSSFPGVRVDSAVAIPDTIEVFEDIVFLWGSYFERLSFPGQPESEQHGRFVTQWVRQANGDWLIKRFFRVPITTLTF
jgi:uncharacterized protein (TIGR02246 family)